MEIKLKSITDEEIERLIQKIIAYRAKHNMSIAKFAKKAHVTIQTIYNIETKTGTPTRLTVAKIERALEE